MPLLFFICALLSAHGAESREFDLGKIDVVARRTEIGEIHHRQVGSSVSRKDMQTFNRNRVGDALNLLSGVTLSTNARNESVISVRGLDSRQVPLFIDGIPVYVPYDGYVDFNRFTTADLSSIQVAKGFSSVAYGPNTLGGAINLVSRKPIKPFEADLTFRAASGEERLGALNLGTNQGKWYLQLGTSYLENESFPLSSDFTPTPTEDGGQRENSYQKDGKLSVKIGITPRQGDEYALSYYAQNGIKGQPPSTDPSRVRYWQWPYWNKQSLYFVSQTTLSEKEILKFRLYHDRFDNKVNAYTDSTYSTLNTSGPGSISSGKSIYHDQTNGGSLNLDSYRLENHFILLALMYKIDDHEELDARGQKNTSFNDELMTIAAEDTINLTDQMSMTLGFSHHLLRSKEVFSRDNPYEVPHSQTANDWQGGLFFAPSKASELYGTVARKTRMPTLKDRFSQRLGTFIQNPGLMPEKALNLEIGYRETFRKGYEVEAALFYSDITDKIQPVANVSGTKSQMQNTDKVRMQGLELGLRGFFLKPLELGGNYTFTHLENIKDHDTKITDIPRHKFIANAIYQLTSSWKIIPFLEYNSRRWISDTKELPGFTTINLKATYAVSKKMSLEAGVTNLGDRNYSLTEGFPSPGRTFFGSALFSY